jgi:ribosomal protein S18 acetylase RimI-like enzyme
MDWNRLTTSVEEAGFNAWPALKEIFYDGWLIRLAHGQTRRTNSVNVIGPGSYPLDEKIRYCEAVYRAHGQPPYFRIRSDGDPALDATLEERGFRVEDCTRTLYMDFDRAPPPEPVKGVRVHLAEGRPGPGWLDAHARFSERSFTNRSTLHHLLDLVALPIAFASARNESGDIVSVAYGAVHDGLVSLQWVATDPEKRRSGLSRATLAVLLGWAANEQDAKGACLQVVADNWPAIRLYEKLGFEKELYRYHYRVK